MRIEIPFAHVRDAVVTCCEVIYNVPMTSTQRAALASTASRLINQLNWRDADNIRVDYPLVARFLNQYM